MNTSDPWPTPVGIIGAGAVGTALCRALVTCGVSVLGVGARHPARVSAASLPAPIRTPAEVVAGARLLFLAVPDSAITSVAGEHHWRAEQWVVHCAGSQPADLLTPFIAPAQAGALHPLAAFPRGTAPVVPGENAFAGRVVAVDGAAEVISGLTALVERLGARAITVPAEARAAYHLAASLVSNLFMALVAQARDVWSAAGLPKDLALPALLPLIASTHAALTDVGLPAALVGPVARGDVVTIQRHLAVLTADPALADVAVTYRALVRRAVALARDLGRASPDALDAIAALVGE